MKIFAHSMTGKGPEFWQPLETHLKNVAEKAAEFAKPFGGEEWARLAGENHDLGKHTRNWQAWLRHVNEISDEFALYYAGHPQHANAGAQWLFQHSKEAGKLLAYCIAGHHGGLPNTIYGLVLLYSPLRKRLLNTAGSCQHLAIGEPSVHFPRRDAVLRRCPPRFLRAFHKPCWHKPLPLDPIAAR